MQKLGVLDASFLDVEDAVSHMHIGLVGIFEGPQPPPEELRNMLLGKLALVPRYRELVRPVPLSIGRPVWVDDEHFSIDYHLRFTAVPAPGGEQELRRLVGRVMSQPLDRRRPLWEMWAVDGLAAGRWALIWKIHHCMVDGVAGSELIDRILQREPDAPETAPEDWRAAPGPSSARLLAGALAETMSTPWRLTRAARTSGVLKRGSEALHGLARMREVAVPAPQSSLNGPLGRNRRWTWARTSLADIKEVRAAFGGTVNDVVLACIAGGIRSLLGSRGEVPVGPVRSLVPVSVRHEDQHGEENNRVAALVAELPVAIEDPVKRLSAVSTHMADLKASDEAAASEVLTSLGGYAAPVIVALAERLATKLPQHNVNTVTTNVPGPQYALYACGRRMLEAYPYVPLAGHVTVGVAIYSYDGACTFGVTGDYDAAPDVNVLGEGIERSLGELLARARRRATPAAVGRAGTAEPSSGRLRSHG